ncbi:MAG: hypothetical protein ACOY3I_10065 [Verrucomicrobiota bacterium]
MSEWVKNGWLKSHQTTSKQIGDLLEIVNRDLEDAQTDISNDWKFGIAYNAALKLCVVLLYAEGYRTEKNLAHYRSIQSLPFILGKHKKNDADYLDACRNKRNIVEYDTAGVVSAKEAQELYDFTVELKQEVVGWLKKQHPKLIE